jgi:hypothetical protein
MRLPQTKRRARPHGVEMSKRAAYVRDEDEEGDKETRRQGDKETRRQGDKVNDLRVEGNENLSFVI